MVTGIHATCTERTADCTTGNYVVPRTWYVNIRHVVTIFLQCFVKVENVFNIPVYGRHDVSVR